MITFTRNIPAHPENCTAGRLLCDVDFTQVSVTGKFQPLDTEDQDTMKAMAIKYIKREAGVDPLSVKEEIKEEPIEP